MEQLRRKLIFIVGVSFTAFHLYVGGLVSIPDHVMRAAHLTFIMILAYLVNNNLKKQEESRLALIIRFSLATASALTGGYILFNYEDLVQRFGIATQLDIVFGIVMILLVCEAARRTVGVVLTGIAAVFLLYGLLGPYLPGLLAHRGYSVGRIAYQMYLTTSGIYGVPIDVSATMIALFVIFGSFLDRSGAGKTFIDLAFSLTGRSRGGPAKAAVVGSALMGTISGSAAANVAVTGTFTIPLMKRAGYDSSFAGAVEAVASTGGQIMPPIMASAAFVMAELTGIPYIQICIAAVPSALLYFFTIFVMVHLKAVQLDLCGSDQDQLPNFMATLKEGVHLLVPFGVLIYLLAEMYSPGFAAFWSVMATILVCMLRKSTRMGPMAFLEAMRDGGTRMIEVGVTCAVAGVIIGMINLTGLGVKLSSLLIALSGGSLLALLFVTMVASIILGMGMPTVAAYLLLAVLVGPALMDVGLSQLQAHMFILYFGTVSAITPPVALAAFTAAGIAEANPMKVGLNAVLLGIAAYIVPYMFVYNPSLLWQGDLIYIILSLLTAMLGCTSLAAGILGQLLRHCVVWERLLLIASGLLLIKPGLITDAIGLLMVAGVATVQYQGRKQAVA